MPGAPTASRPSGAQIRGAAAGAALGLSLGLLVAGGLGRQRGAGAPPGFTRLAAQVPRPALVDPGAAPRGDAWVLSHGEALVAEGAAAVELRAEGGPLRLGGAAGPLARWGGDAAPAVQLGRAGRDGRLGGGDGCPEAALPLAPGGALGLRLRPALAAASGGAEAACGRAAEGGLRLQAETAPVALRGLIVDGRALGPPLPAGAAALAGLGGALLGALLGALRGQARRPWGPALLGGALVGLAAEALGPAALAGGLRAAALAGPWAPARLGLAAALLLGARGAAAGAVGAALAAGLLGAREVPGLLAFAGAGAAAGALRAGPPGRGAARAALGLGLALGALGLGELGLRRTATGAAWARAAAWADGGLLEGAADPQRLATTAQELDHLEAGGHTRYPSTGYPVAPDPRAPGRLRVLCFGGSSTGGAYTDDDLGAFYPARLEALLQARRGPGAPQVVNQGVGGWTSFHIRRYVEAQSAALDPDLVTLYIGTNDAAARLPVDLATLDRLRRRRGWLRGALAPLRGLALGQGLAAALGPLRLGAPVAAVSPADLAENVRAIVARAPRALLITEANHPDARALAAHHRALLALADGDRVRALDASAALSGRPAYFRDRTHLSPAGHEALAGLIAGALEGWALPAAAAGAP